MKLIFSFFLIICWIDVYSQQKPPVAQKSSVNIKGNNNTVTVIQSGRGVQYDFSKEGEKRKLAEHIMGLPNMQQYFKEWLEKADKAANKADKAAIKVDRAADKVDKAADKFENLTDLLVELTLKSKSNNLVSEEEICRNFEHMMVEFATNRKELEDERKKTTNKTYSDVLKSAILKYDQLDNNGFQEILSEFAEEREKSNSDKEAISSAWFFLARNSYNSFKFEEALVQIGRAFDENPSDNKISLLMGDILKGMDLFSEALTAYERVVPTDNFMNFHLNNSKAQVYLRLEKFTDALNFYKATLNIDISNLDAREVEIPNIMDEIGLLYLDMNQLDSSANYLKKSLNSRLRLFGERHLDVSLSYGHLGNLFYSRGDSLLGLVYHEKAYVLQEKLVVGNHPYKATTYLNIGNYFNNLNLDAAIIWYNMALDMLSDLSQQNSVNFSIFLNSKGAAFSNFGNCDSAIVCYNKSIKIQKILLGEKHSMIGTSYMNIANCLVDGSSDSALAFYFEAEKVFLENEDTNKSKLATLYHNMSFCYFIQKRYEEAMKYAVNAKNDRIDLNEQVASTERLIRMIEDGLNNAIKPK